MISAAVRATSRMRSSSIPPWNWYFEKLAVAFVLVPTWTCPKASGKAWIGQSQPPLGRASR
jgi:hypothetical protein